MKFLFGLRALSISSLVKYFEVASRFSHRLKIQNRCLFLQQSNSIIYFFKG
jgi:hypothetical protein